MKFVSSGKDVKRAFKRSSRSPADHLVSCARCARLEVDHALGPLWPRSDHCGALELCGRASPRARHARSGPCRRRAAVPGVRPRRCGLASLELPLGRALGIEGKLGGIILAEGDAPRDPRLAKQGSGTVFFGTAGVRVHPFAAPAGPWASAGFGFAQTGSRTRPGLDIALGWDFRVGNEGRWDVGPFAGYMLVIQPDDALRPNDAHIVSLGIQVGLGAKERARGDRDKDAIFDDEDACPDDAGIRTDDPKTNGCPRGDRDKDTVFDDEDACPDDAGIRTDDPKTNGCPRAIATRTRSSTTRTRVPTSPAFVRTIPARTAARRRIAIRTGSPTRKTRAPTSPVFARRIRPRTAVLRRGQHPCRERPDPPRRGHPLRPEQPARASRELGHPEEAGRLHQRDARHPLDKHRGHADATGTERHNLVLSRERAESVRRLLVRFGVDPGRLEAEAFGRSRLKVQTKRAEAANRRVEFWITRTSTAPSVQSPAPARQEAP